MKPARFFVAGLLCLVLFASPAVASSGHVQNSQSLYLPLQGMISNAGNQHYQVSGGKLAPGSALNGQDVSSDNVRFNLDASVHGPAGASGRGSLEISAQGNGGHGDQWGNSLAAADGGHGGHGGQGGHGDHNNGVVVQIDISITGVIQAAIFPLTMTSPTSYNNCDPASGGCNSEIPLFFTGVATIDSHGGQDGQGGHGGHDGVTPNDGDQQTQVPIAIESPYWNPFGGPILIASLDSTTSPSIFLIVHYDRATIDWDGVQLQGALGPGTGSLGTEQITSGFYSQSVNSHEDLVAGSESDSGSIAFAGMSDPSLNANGRFSGQTSFTTAGSFDCATPNPILYFPGLPDGTCTATGATSNGSFHMNGAQDLLISGSYVTGWSTPSLFTATQVIGAVAQH